MVQALLLAIWAGLCEWDQLGPHLGFRKPLLASVGVGIILGDMTTAIIIGATTTSARTFRPMSSPAPSWVRRWASCPAAA